MAGFQVIGKFISAFLVCLLGISSADTVSVIVGDAGCVARQNTIKTLWTKLPGVTAITLLPRRARNPGGQRTFVIVSRGASPTADEFRAALGRREKNFPILEYQPVEEALTSPGP